MSRVAEATGTRAAGRRSTGKGIQRVDDDSGDAGVTVSVIVPVSERPANLAELYREYSEPLRVNGEPFEFVFVSEPYNRAFTAALSDLRQAGEPLRILEAGQAVGDSALVKSGIANARGRIILTLPAYQRVVPEALPRLIASVRAGSDLAIARRWPRRDRWVNRMQTAAFHKLIQRLVGAPLNDVASGVRAFRREVLEEMPLYGDFFRFFPLFAVKQGYRVVELDAAQHEGDVATRVYSPGIYLRRALDVLGLFFLLRFTDKPLRFFGLIGATLSLAGGATLVVLAVQRLGGQGIANRPLLLLGVLLLVLGVQSIALGLIGEIIVHLRASQRLPYRLRTR